MEAELDKPSLFGPRPQGTAAEWPAIGSPRPEHDSLAITDSATVGGQAFTRLTELPYNTAQSVALPNLGDKALWNARRQMLHVLYLQHVLNVRVQTTGTPARQQQQAVMLAKLIIDRLGKAGR